MAQLPDLLDHPRYEQVQCLKAMPGRSSVMLAADKVTGGLVALKLLGRRQVGFLGYAENEVLNNLRLRHPHIIALKEVFLTNDYLVLVSDYMPGGDLARLVSPAKVLSEVQARWLFSQAMFALEYCHRMGLAHRDISPEHILVDQSNLHPIIKLSGFGLSTFSEVPDDSVHLSTLIHTGIVGNPEFCAPEVLSSTAAPSSAQKADVWSCGALLYWMLTGHGVLQGTAGTELGSQATPDLDHKLPESLSRDCKNLIASMLAHDPCDRPSVKAIFQHPWCSESMHPSTLVHFNDALVARTLSKPSDVKVLRDVCSIVDEACMGPDNPSLRDVEPAQQAAAADHLDAASDSGSSEESMGRQASQ